MIDVGMTQLDLIQKVVEKGVYLDGGYLWKILKGKRNAPKVKEAIEIVLSEAEKG